MRKIAHETLAKLDLTPARAQALHEIERAIGDSEPRGRGLLLADEPLGPAVDSERDFRRACRIVYSSAGLLVGIVRKTTTPNAPEAGAVLVAQRDPWDCRCIGWFDRVFIDRVGWLTYVIASDDGGEEIKAKVA